MHIILHALLSLDGAATMIPSVSTYFGSVYAAAAMVKSFKSLIIPPSTFTKFTRCIMSLLIPFVNEESCSEMYSLNVSPRHHPIF